MKRLVLAVLGATLLACAEPSLKGRMEQPLLACGAGRAYLVAPDGGIAWSKSGCGNIHRVWLREN